MTRIVGAPQSRRRRWMYGATALLSVIAVLLIVSAAGATLLGSTFNTTNGDLTSASLHDWNPPVTGVNLGPVESIDCGTAAQIPHAGTNCGTDLVKNTSDNSFGQGTKEDDLTPTVVSGQIPPNKDDLTRFYVNKEHRNVTGCAPGTSTPDSCDYLYMAWERTNTLGSAHMDFEFNQKFCDVTAPTATTCNTNNQTPLRSPGDVLITYDFGGSGTPVLGLLRWVDATNGTASDCFSANALPCWGKFKDLTAASEADGSVNGQNRTDNNPPSNPITLTGSTTLDTKGNVKSISSTFGEAGVNLTGANLFPQGTCFHLGSAYLKSRSSGSSFTSEIKDFIAPIPVNISNCGEVIIKKHTSPRGVNKDFSYTSSISGSSLTAGSLSGVTGAPCREAATGYTNPYTLNDNGNSTGDSTGNTDDCANVPVGSYTVTEGANPAGFTFTDLSCTATGTGTSVTPASGNSTKTASITMAADGLVTCTYTNTQNTATLSTAVDSGSPFTPGTQLRDTATIIGSQSSLTPSGDVTFFLCSFATGSTDVCDGSAGHVGTSLGTGTLSGSGTTATAHSPYVNTTLVPLTAGRYCFRAEWPGDNGYASALTEWGGSSGATECFSVAKLSTQTVTTPNDGSGVAGAESTITLGSTIYDTAVVTGTQAGGDPDGSVTFFVCKLAAPDTCDKSDAAHTGDPVGNAAVPLVSDGVLLTYTSSATSAGFKPLSVGRYCFRGEYGGSTVYLASDDHAATECFTVTDTTGITSAQDWLPNDSATLSSTNGAPLNGTLSFTLYDGIDCGVHKSDGTLGTVVLRPAESFPIGPDTASPVTKSTTNTSVKVSASEKVSWKVVFDSTAGSNVSGSNHCESSNLVVTN